MKFTFVFFLMMAVVVGSNSISQGDHIEIATTSISSSRGGDLAV